MKVKLPLMIQDPVASASKSISKLAENEEFAKESFFLDGPVTKQVAVLDFDDETGQSAPLVRLLPTPDKKGFYRYDITIPSLGEEITHEFMRVTVLGTILKTISLATDEKALSRELDWAFEGNQLLVIPRAGEWKNAYYERDTHSLQFFYFQNEQNETVYTALSRDIVAHETAHAILDSIAPDLYDALTPQSLAIHEAFADITAVLMATNSTTLAKAILDKTKGSLEGDTAFTIIAEQFGLARGDKDGLRNLNHIIGMNDVTSVEPHELSTVLSSAFYELLVKTFNERKAGLIVREGENFSDPDYSLSGKALAVSAEQIARMLYRALDYLPPGEVSFIDYGKAIMAADSVAFGGKNKYRDFLIEAFLKRDIIKNATELQARINFEHTLEIPLDLQDLVKSDWVAYDFANRYRKLLMIPEGIPSFKVLPRLETTKKVRSGDDKAKDIVFRVTWEHFEENNVNNHSLPPKRRVTVGTSLVINAERSKNTDNATEGNFIEFSQTGRQVKGSVNIPQKEYKRFSRSFSEKSTLFVRAILTSAPQNKTAYEEAHNKALRLSRDEMLKHLIQSGLLALDEQPFGPGEKLRPTVVHGKRRNDVLSIKGTANMLHIVGEE